MQEATQYALVGGKKMRMRLVYAAAEDLACQHMDIDRIAIAVEMAHIYSLCHDDLPCIDNDHVRHGKPSLHAQYGEAMAVLVGDALQSMAIEQILACESHTMELMKEFNKSIGPRGLVRGQLIDTLNLAESETILEMYKAKTGMLIASCLILPALLCGQKDLIEPLNKAGHLFGILYQIQDDHIEALVRSEGQKEKRHTATSLLPDSLEHTKQMFTSSIQDTLDDIDFSACKTLITQLIESKKYRPHQS
tara:strand:+ start:3805 stop:4551 length:747 start_codon:yes stop_codon:yes gene_type:complete